MPFDEAKWFRGRETHEAGGLDLPRRVVLPPRARRARRALGGQAWPSARVHVHMFSPLPSGTFPGVDDAEVYAFLEAHADQ